MCKQIKRKMFSIMLVFILLACFSGCTDMLESRIEKVNDTIGSVLADYNVAFEVETRSNKQNETTTKRGKKTYYYFNSYIEIKDETLTNEEIFDLIEAVENINISYTSVYRFYTINGDPYYISDGCILIKGYDHEIAYTPIAQKQVEELTYSEKQAICNWIESQYTLYDIYSGGYSGDKYSDEIFDLASQVFNISVEDLDIIWMKRYSGK